MNVVILNDYGHIQGGAAQVAVLSAYGLAEQGHKVTFIYASGEADELLSHPNIDCIGLGQHDLLRNPSRKDAAVKGLWNRAVEQHITMILSQFDHNSTIVHVHSWVKALSISALASVARSGLSMSITLHDYFSICPNGGLYNYQRQQVCALRPMSFACLTSNCDSRSYGEKLWRYLRQGIYKKAGFPARCQNFITVSDFSESLLKSYLPVQSRFWQVLNPVDMPRLSPFEPHQSRTFTFIGRLSPEKGVSLLTKLKQIPDKELRFVGAGEMEGSLKEKLPNAEFLGWCDKSAIIKALGDTRALLFTSKLYETQGLVVAEAAALGIPAIVSDITSAQEFIVPEQTGLLFKSGDPASLEEQMLRLREDDNLVKKMGVLSYERYWQNPPSINAHVAELLSCYHDILQEVD